MKRLAAIFILGSVAHATDVRLVWNASTTPGVTNYVLYASTNALTFQSFNVRTNAGINLIATVQTLRAGQWQFGVTATKDGLESGMSEVLNVEIPKTPGPIRTVIVQWSTNLTNRQDVGFFKLRIP